MIRDDVLKALKDAEPDLRAQGVARAAVFGSVARGEEGSDSDIDIMVEIDATARVDLFRYVGIIQSIEALFPTPVDVANRASLKDHVRPQSERDAIYAF